MNRFDLFQDRKHGNMAARWFCCAGILFLVFTNMPRLAVALEADASPSAAASPTELERDPGTAASSAAISPDAPLLLEVQVNGRPTGNIGEFKLVHARLMARRDELRDLGFRIPATLAPDAHGLIALSDLPGVTWNIDLKNQVLYVKASDSALIPTLFMPDERIQEVGRREIVSGTGLTLNDDIVGTFSGGQAGVSGYIDLRGFAPWGTLNSDWLTFAGPASGAPGKTAAVRLDSAYTFADVNTLRRYSLGDFINSGLTWNRPVHLEGAQLRSDFSMRPDLVTIPLPTISGSAAVPSTVDVLVNGNMVVSHQVDGGPFEISQLPVISGAGIITMNMTNAQGQQVSVSTPFYGGSSLLAPGLQTYSGQAGLVRRNWGTVSNDYGKMAGTAFYRRGLTQQFTIEAEGEGTPGATMAGVGGALLVGHLGLLNVDAAVSGNAGKLGELFSVGAQHMGTKFSLGGSAIFANSSYRDVASMNGSGVVRKELSAFIGLSNRKYGSVGLAYAGEDADASPTEIQTNGSLAEHSHIVTANYSLQIRHVSFYATEFKSLDTGGSSSLQVGFTIPLGKRSSASVSASSTGSGQVQAQQSAVRVGDWGYQGYVSGGGSNHEFGQVQYKSPVGLFTAGADYTAGQTTLRLESQGAISLVDHGVFPSNTIYDSFAIVDTSPIPHVHVLQENRDVGTTNKAGRLLVPDMRSFDLNRIGISPTDIPADATLISDKRELRPQDRSGVVVRFPIQFNHSAVLHLTDQAGAALPTGSTATLRATHAAFPVGYDGEAYLEHLNPHNELDVALPNGKHCAVTFDYLPASGDIPAIGPLRCVEKKTK